MNVVWICRVTQFNQRGGFPIQSIPKIGGEVTNGVVGDGVNVIVPFRYFREICRIVFFSFSLTSLRVRVGLMTVTAAPALISVRIFLSAMAPPPTTTTFFPEILRKAG